jgi:glycerol-3-phosphate dehydrogenase
VGPLLQLAADTGIELPIMDAVASLLNGGLDIKDAGAYLMNRALKDE